MLLLTKTNRFGRVVRLFNVGPSCTKGIGANGKEIVVDKTTVEAEQSHQKDDVASRECHSNNFIELFATKALLAQDQEQTEKSDKD